MKLRWGTLLVLGMGLMAGRSCAQEVVFSLDPALPGGRVFFSVVARGEEIVRHFMDVDHELIMHDVERNAVHSLDTEALRANAAGKDADAQYLLGVAEIEGRTSSESPFADAYGWFKESSERGNRRAQNSLGSIYLRGRGTPQNFVQGKRWLEASANAGILPAEFNLGYAYFWLLFIRGPQEAPRRAEWEKDVRRSRATAQIWLERAARREVAIAEFYLGVTELWKSDWPEMRQAPDDQRKHYEMAYEWFLRSVAHEYAHWEEAKRLRDMTWEILLKSNRSQTVKVQAQSARSYVRDVPPPPVKVLGPTNTAAATPATAVAEGSGPRQGTGAK